MAQTARGTIGQARRGRSSRRPGPPAVPGWSRWLASDMRRAGWSTHSSACWPCRRRSSDAGRRPGPEGAIQTIAEQSKLLLVLIAIGLFGYALWRFVQGILDPENKGRDAKGLAKRGAMVASGVVYAGLALLAFRLISQDGGGAGAGGQASTTAKLLGLPFGRALVILAGIAVIVSALYQIYEAYTKKFQRRMKTAEMSPEEQRLAIRTGQLGLASRGVAFLITGWFLIQAALSYDPSQARGLGGALETLARPALRSVAAGDRGSRPGGVRRLLVPAGPLPPDRVLIASSSG